MKKQLYPKPYALNPSLKGFTLLELLITLSILAILTVVLVIVINPAEVLKKTRDNQRLSDLSTLKSALSLYLAEVSTPVLGPTADCLGVGITTAVIYYSVPQTSDTTCAINVVEGTDVTSASTFGGVGGATDSCKYVTLANLQSVSNTGWIPVDFTSISSLGGSPISNLPIDPTNTVSGTNGNAPVSTDLAYRYACQRTSASPAPGTVFELDANLESAAYINGGSQDKESKDGGDNADLFEMGTSIKLMGNSANY